MNKEIIFVDSVDKDRQAFHQFKEAKVLGIDTETSGLSFKYDRLWSIQVSDGNVAALYPVNGESKYFPFLAQLLQNPAILKAAHNMSFDFKFLKYNGYTLKNVYCTQVAENVLEAGRVMRGNFNLKSTLERNLGLKLDKTVRKDFYDPYTKKPSEANPLGVINEKYFGLTKEWTDALIHYACDDVFFLPALVENQTKRAKENELEKTMYLEQYIVPHTAMMEYRGIRVDLKMLEDFENRMRSIADAHATSIKETLYEKWKALVDSEYEASTKAYEDWDAQYQKVLAENTERDGRKLSAKSKAAREAIRALKPKKPALPVEFNIDSPEQVKHALAANGINLPNLQKDNLQDYAGEHAVIDSLISYSKYSKLGEFCLIKNKVGGDGILHPTLNQAGTDTGRYSSSAPNSQNIPARTEEGKQLRACFKPPPGFKLVSADYSAIELVIVGILSNDERLLQAMREGKDLHLWTMSFFTGVDYDILKRTRDNDISIIEMCDVEEAMKTLGSQMHLPGLVPYIQCIGKFSSPDYRDEMNSYCKGWLDTFRDYIKTITYGLAYGLSSHGLSRKFKCSPDDAQKFIDIFFQVYPAIKAFLDAEGAKGLSQGYSVNINGRRRYYTVPSLPLYGSCSREMYEVLRKAHFRARSRVMRQSANMVIQSLSADITKLAIAKTAKKLDENGFPEDRGLILCVHDELILSVEAARADEAGELLKVSMEEAATQILGSVVPIEVTAKITDCWQK